MDVLQAIRTLLDREEVSYHERHHEPTLTSEASARARGEDLRIGGKALVLKIDESFAVFVLSATQSLDSSAIKKQLGVRKLRFASPTELYDLTGLVPGAIPPFGHPILPYDLYVDPSILENRRIAFNAGSLTHSVLIGVDDYVRVANPTVFRFAVAKEKSQHTSAGTNSC